jgi:hypothetical protein
MYSIRLFLVTLLPAVLAQSTTSCPACDSLAGLWSPNGNTGSCIGSLSDPVAYISGFEQCLCGTQGQDDYSACVACNINGDGGVPIDGLNFGGLSGFQSACSIFASDVTSVLQPSGLAAFASVVAPVLTASGVDVASVDLLGYYIFENVVSASGAATGLITDSVGGGETSPTTSPTMTPILTTPTTMVMTTMTAATGSRSLASTVNPSGLGASTHKSDAGRNSLELRWLVGILAIAVLGALF